MPKLTIITVSYGLSDGPTLNVEKLRLKKDTIEKSPSEAVCAVIFICDICNLCGEMIALQIISGI